MVGLRMTGILAMALLSAATVRAAAPPKMPPWADQRLPVTGGLDVWLDLSVQNAARQGQGKTELADGDPMDVVYDASGHGRHFGQADEAAQPQYRTIAGTGVARFDGLDDHLAHEEPGRQYDECTVFIVVNPFSNLGEFRAVLAMNRSGANDYQSGLNVDLGPLPTTRFESLNAEGPGFGGAVNLLDQPAAFGRPRLVVLASAAGTGGTRLWTDGQPQRGRDRLASALSADRFTLGARFYNNLGPANVRGFLEGDVAELLVYNRVLADAERRQVEQYLAGKHAELFKAIIELPSLAGGGKRLTSVPCPNVQMFVPGFVARPLGVDLPNINNVRYRPDGTLVALAYDGNVYLLSDTDGDGVEDRSTLFFENRGTLRSPIGMALTPPDYPRGDGLFVASKGSLSLIVDDDGDDVADRRLVVTDGWQELPHGVDALGVAYNRRDGSVYFGLGTADFTNPYQLDDKGAAGYRLQSIRGTVLKMSADLSRREVFCTGVRFPVGMAFNSRGDLFATDQEGATWLVNGNPFDELLHLQEGRHYGFPPRHPQHLRDVVDEPSVFDYRPQHQSTCGLCFNEPDGGFAVFGPAWWSGDALVCGYSRGKLYRTRLVKTAAGYVAGNQQVAALDMLAADACFSPRGELLIAVHSGGPDWGSGPSGKGKLYKLAYVGRDVPQPVAAWAQSPYEVRIAFDAPLDPAQLNELASRVSIEYGRYVGAGDRFEALRPGYQVVQDQLRLPRFDLAVHAVQLTGDRRTLVLTTARQADAVGYAITLAGMGSPPDAGAPAEETRVPPVDAIDLAYDLNGVDARWQSQDGRRTWQGWLPHPDLAVSRKLTAHSADHDALWAAVDQPGVLTLRTKADLWQMLRPAVQTGSRIDYELPAEQVTLTLTASGRMRLESATGVVEPLKDGKPGEARSLTLSPQAEELVPLTVVLDTLSGGPGLSVAWHTSEDPRPRAMPLVRWMLPWASRGRDLHAPLAAEPISELEGGSWARGRKVFYGERAACSRCHAIDGDGGRIGPDLSNLVERDYHSVLRDVTQPSYAINPDYVTYQILLADGRLLEGPVRSEQNKLHVADAKGNVTIIDAAGVEEMSPASLSIMPSDILKEIPPDELRDLMTYLLGPGPRMPVEAAPALPPPPPARSRDEVERAMAGTAESADPPRLMRIVLVAGPKDHGPGEHDYPAWQKAWQELLSVADNVQVSTAWEWPSAEQLQSADVLVFYQRGTWTADRAKAIDPFLARGGGMVSIHYAVSGDAGAEEFAERIGLAWRDGHSRFRHGPLTLRFSGGHPITRNFEQLELYDESYWRLIGDAGRIDLLADGMEEQSAQPLVWAVEHEQGRAVVSIPGHYSWTFDDPLFRLLLLRSIAWTAREPIDRFNPIVTLGARMAK